MGQCVVAMVIKYLVISLMDQLIKQLIKWYERLEISVRKQNPNIKVIKNNNKINSNIMTCNVIIQSDNLIICNSRNSNSKNGEEIYLNNEMNVSNVSKIVNNKQEIPFIKYNKMSNVIVN